LLKFFTKIDTNLDCGWGIVLHITSQSQHQNGGYGVGGVRPQAIIRVLNNVFGKIELSLRVQALDDTSLPSTLLLGFFIWEQMFPF